MLSSDTVYKPGIPRASWEVSPIFHYDIIPFVAEGSHVFSRTPGNCPDLIAGIDVGQQKSSRRCSHRIVREDFLKFNVELGVICKDDRDALLKANLARTADAKGQWVCIDPCSAFADGSQQRDQRDSLHGIQFFTYHALGLADHLVRIIIRVWVPGRGYNRLAMVFLYLQCKIGSRMATPSMVGGNER